MGKTGIAALVLLSMLAGAPSALAQDIAPEVDELRKALLEDARTHQGRANGIKVQGRALMERDFKMIAACEGRAERMRRAAGLITRAQGGTKLSSEETQALAAALEELKKPLKLGPAKPRLPDIRPPKKPKAKKRSKAAKKLAKIDAEIAALERRAQRARLEAEHLALRLELLRVERALIEARQELRARKGKK